MDDAGLRSSVNQYKWHIKQLLGVRLTTCNDLCYVESGFPPLNDLVKEKQRKFFSKMWHERQGMVDDPLSFTLGLVMNSRYRTGNYVSELIGDNVNYIHVGWRGRRAMCGHRNHQEGVFTRGLIPD